MRELIQSPRFARSVKKFHPNEKKVIREVLEEIIRAPEHGDAKKGNLAGVYTRSFRLHNAQYRLSYRFDDDKIELIRIGSRENFYE